MAEKPLSLDDMVLFAEVVEAGSFTAAGRNLGLPKSTVSRRISRLERQLGATLLNRTTRSLKLTDSGNAYVVHCRRIVAEAREAAAQVSDLQSDPAGTLRITVAANFAAIMGELLASFLQKHARIRVELFATDQVVDLVAEGIDFAFRFGTLPDSTYIARKVGTTRGVLCASPDYLARAGEPRTLAELKRHTCIHYGLGARDHIWRFHDETGMQTVESVGRLAVNDFATMGQAVLHGLGIAALPDLLFRAEIQAGRLVPILQHWGFRTIDLSLVYPGGRHLPRRSRAFIDHVPRWFADNPLWSTVNATSGRGSTRAVSPDAPERRRRRRSPAAGKNSGKTR